MIGIRDESWVPVLVVSLLGLLLDGDDGRIEEVSHGFFATLKACSGKCEIRVRSRSPFWLAFGVVRSPDAMSSTRRRGEKTGSEEQEMSWKRTVGGNETVKPYLRANQPEHIRSEH